MTDVDFVNSLYLNVLARDPDAEGVNAWVSQINNGASYDQVRVAFIFSVETQTFVNPIVRLYEGLLNRLPDADGLKTWANVLRGGTSLDSITDSFLHSSEGVANGFGDAVSNAQFVNNLYLSMGRDQAQIDADPGFTEWVNTLDSDALSRATVAQAFMESAENLEHSYGFVTYWAVLGAIGNPQPTTAQLEALNVAIGLYENVLARNPDGDGLNTWVSQITGGATHATVTAAFLESTEAQTFVNPIIRLYEGLLNRAPDTEGLRNSADALHGGRSPNDIANDFLNSPEAIANGFGDLDNHAFVNKLYLSMGRTQEQIDADTAGVEGWVEALGTMSRAEVAQAFMESAENLQNSNGFVTGWGALRAAGNPGPTTAQLDNFSDTATIEQIIASADAVGTSTTTWPTGEGADPYNISDTAAHLAAADARLLNGATAIDAIGDAVTLTDAQVTNAIIAKFDASDHLTLNAASGMTLSALSAATLSDPRVVALNAGDNAVTLTDAQVTNAIIAKFDASDHLTLNAASGMTLSALSAAMLNDPRVVALNAADDALTLNDYDDGKVTNETIAKFDTSDRLELNANHGATFSALSAATLGDARVSVLDAFDNAVTLTNEQVTDVIVTKFDLGDTLTLNAPGATLSALSTETLKFGNASLVLNATDNAITLTADQFLALDVRDHVDASDDITIESGTHLDALDLRGVGGRNVTVKFEAFDDVPDDIHNFDVDKDALQFSKAAFAAASLPAAGNAIAAEQLLSAADVNADGGTGFTADQSFLYNTVNGELFYDTDGVAGGAVWVATLANLPLLTADDIIMIA